MRGFYDPNPTKMKRAAEVKGRLPATSGKSVSHRPSTNALSTLTAIPSQSSEAVRAFENATVRATGKIFPTPTRGASSRAIGGTAHSLAPRVETTRGNFYGAT